MRIVIASLLLLVLQLPTHAWAWGFWAHRYVNRLAVFTLPPEMFGFYKYHIDDLTELATKPDLRRSVVPGEAERHFMDLDRYGTLPFSDLPRTWTAAVEKYTEDTLRKHGIAPYNLPWYVKSLTDAFKKRDAAAIIRYASDLGHYVGDVHVPLHTTRNYDGQLTNQRGIHGLWESRLPELYAERQYDMFVLPATYISRVQDLTWQALFESHVGVDSVLRFEKELSEQFPEDQKYSYESRNGLMMRVYSREFSNAYHTRLNNQVERRMRQAVYRLGCLWLTAWMDAGKPNLDSLVNMPTFVADTLPATTPLPRALDRERDFLNDAPSSGSIEWDNTLQHYAMLRRRIWVNE